MQVRRAGEPATPQIAVFVHGLGETEHAWGSPSYGDRLQRDLGLTPVFVRFNSGRRISENGASLAALLDELVDGWPVAVERIVIVGHSMGGLVARSACHDGGDWTPLVSHVISLGTPHMGAPLEQAVHAMSAALHLAPETRPFARLLRRRSAGIRDLRRGSLVDEDWLGQDPDALRAKASKEVPLLEGATHCFVAATVTRSAKHPLGRLLGDALVLAPSASGRSRTRRLAFDDGLSLGRTHHLALLNHPEVYEQLRAWLEAPRS
jgi:pimeloyl-ACP methyl ester carboxylesterase